MNNELEEFDVCCSKYPELLDDGFNIPEKFNRVLIRASERPLAYEVCDEKFKGFYNRRKYSG